MQRLTPRLSLIACFPKLVLWSRFTNTYLCELCSLSKCVSGVGGLSIQKKYMKAYSARPQVSSQLSLKKQILQGNFTRLLFSSPFAGRPNPKL